MKTRTFAAVALTCVAASAARAQTFATNDPVLRRIWTIGMDSSRTYDLAQALTDSIGPRLTGTPQQKAGNDWLVATYKSWGVDARNEQYGSWRGWRRGVTHVDIVSPRVRSLEGTTLAWSPGTKGAVQAPAVVLPDVQSAAEFERWLPNAKGKYVLISMAQPTCRPDTAWAASATPESYARMKEERAKASAAWQARILRTAAPGDSTFGLANRNLPLRLERAGARGVITNLWSQGWGVDKIFNARTTTIPTLDLSCEDYGLVFRLAERNQGPVLRVDAESQALGEVPVFNTIAEIRGSEKPDEYVMLSAHFDSWDGGSGATDNGTGTVTMMEAMRILKQVYPHPKRTILVGHWSGEEQGLVGSRAFAADHPEIVKGLQALFNQDNGTGRIVNISATGLVNAGGNYANWLARLPAELTRGLNISFPGMPGGGGSDYASFICYGAPAFNLGSLPFDYFTYTWHTNRDSFDKIVFDDLKSNATMTAMLVYLASEDPTTVPRDRRIMPDAPNGAPQDWPPCQTPPRKSSEWTR
ncbi:MAG: M20/M25/M40 family metallo-hydrolase [Gemmatimonadaceae bacterium]|nr:M20/M25/M40 family metallo-hydrolase [Gemmatimonadaceae bacterium]